MGQPEGEFSPHGRKEELRFALHLLKGNRLVLIGLVISVFTLATAVLSHLLVDPSIATQQPLALRLCWNNPIINWGYRTRRPVPPVTHSGLTPTGGISFR